MCLTETWPSCPDRQGKACLGEPGGLKEDRVRDLTTEQAVLDTATLNTIVAESADCVKLLDLDARLLSMNAGGQQTMEIENFDVCRNLLWPEFWQGEDRLRVETALDLARLGERCSFEGQAATFRGTPRWWAVKIAPVFDEHGAVYRLLAISRDITVQKQAELALSVLNASLEAQVALRTVELQQRNAELQAANEELEAFTYSASHDLRTPVRHVQSFSQLARRALADDSPTLAAKHLGFVEQAAQRMTTLIDAMVQLSRSTRASLKLGPVDLNAVLGRMRLDLERDLRERQVEWKIGTLPVVWGDETLLQQALGNLLENAVKFSRNQEYTLIEVWTEENASTWSVFVRDNGVGFDARYQERLFGVFQRLHTDREFEGTGMGLATVRRIVLRHGGTVSASSPGQGATFGFTLPRNRRTGPGT